VHGNALPDVNRQGLSLPVVQEVSEEIADQQVLVPPGKIGMC
jgi:hypothetical protein